MNTNNKIPTLLWGALYVGIFTFPLLILASCTKCDDCEPSTTYAFGITNPSDETVDFTFYFGMDSTSFTVDPAENLELTNISRWGASGPLTLPPLDIFEPSGPSPHDSVRMTRTPYGLSRLYLNDDCVIGNPLCVESYLISEVVNRSSDGDVTTKKYLYTIE